MCGIAGKIYFKNREINKNKEFPLIRKSLEKLHHRGPDDSGYIIDNNVWLGAARLSIIDLSVQGHQPMRNEDESIFLVFNGEIYNHQEIKRQLTKRHKFVSKTDSEVLLHLYEEKGIGCLRYLRGMFAFAIWNRKKQELFIARDRIGKKPVKYFYNDKFFVFASELKAFIDHPDIPKAIDWEAVDEFLTYQYVPSPKTGFKDIYKLPSAHYMIIKPDGKIVIRRYWQIDFSDKLNLSENEWRKSITDKLQESVKLRLESDVSLGVHLSGGIDSGMVTAFASLNSKNSVKTFSLGFEESRYNELPYARLIAQRYHTDHHEAVVKPDIIELLPNLVYQYEEPFADPSLLPAWLLMRESKKHFTVALNGDGGDENFAGYRRYLVMELFNLVRYIPYKNRLSDLFYFLYKLYSLKDLYNTARLLKFFSNKYEMFYQEMISFIDTETKNKLYTAEFKQKIMSSRAKNFLIGKFNKRKTLNRLDQLLDIEVNTYLPEVLLTKTDISSMAHSLEVRSPFLDHEFMELTAKMPVNLKLRGFQLKYLLKKIAPKYLPQECFVRRKQGFIAPLDYWFRDRLSKYLNEQLLAAEFITFGIFKREELKRLIAEHKEYKRDNSYAIWTILCLKQWLDTYCCL